MTMWYIGSHIAMLWSPLHELGHVVFGWLTLNPAFVTGWTETSSLFPFNYLMKIGGGMGEFIGIALIYMAMLKWLPTIIWLRVIPYFMWICSFLHVPAIIWSDLPHDQLRDGKKVMFIFAVLSIIFMMVWRIRWQVLHRVAGATWLERRLEKRNNKMP
jgi:hypothetical protein